MTNTTAIGYTSNLPVTDPHCFEVRDVELPPLGPHDILVQVEAVSVNPVDVKLRASAPADGFRVLGFDAAGTVQETGSEVSEFAVGDTVFYAGAIDRPGTNQRLHIVDERIVGHKPASLSFADAAALPLTALTAWESLFDRLRLTAESRGTLLVLGATGGVGSMMLQLAQELLPDVVVIATASDEARADWVRDLGAEHVVDHHRDLVPQVSAIAPDGVDWVFTAHSEGQIPTYAEIVRPFGDIVAIDDGPRDVSPLKARSIAWHWELMFTRSQQQTPDMLRQHAILDKVAALVDAGRLSTTTTTRLSPISPATLREAHSRIESGRTMGKVTIEGW